MSSAASGADSVPPSTPKRIALGRIFVFALATLALLSAIGTGSMLYILTGMARWTLCAIVIHQVVTTVRRRRLSPSILHWGAVATLCLAVNFYYHHSVERARQFVADTAQLVQLHCNTRSRCPESLPGWEKGWGAVKSRTVRRSLATGWVFRYMRSEDGRRYSIALVRGLDITDVSRGQVGMQGPHAMVTGTPNSGP